MNELRRQHARSEVELRERDCAIGTEILAIQNRLSRYDPRRHTETHRMLDKQRAVQDARRHNRMACDENMRRRHGNLLTLVNEYLIRQEGV